LTYQGEGPTYRSPGLDLPPGDEPGTASPQRGPARVVLEESVPPTATEEDAMGVLGEATRIRIRTKTRINTRDPGEEPPTMEFSTVRRLLDSGRSEI